MAAHSKKAIKKVAQHPKRGNEIFREMSTTLAVAVAAVVLLLVDSAFADTAGLARLSSATPDLLFLVVSVIGLCLVQFVFYSARSGTSKSAKIKLVNCGSNATVGAKKMPVAPHSQRVLGAQSTLSSNVMDSQEVDHLLRTIRGALKPEEAEESFQRLLHLGTLGAKPDITALRSAVQHMSSIGFSDCAVSWLDAMREAGFAFDVSTYAGVLESYSKHEHAERAQEVIQQMRENDIAPDAACYAALIRVLAKTGAVKAAETWLDTIIMESNVQPTSEMLTSVVLGYCKKSDPEAAEKMDH